MQLFNVIVNQQEINKQALKGRNNVAMGAAHWLKIWNKSIALKGR